MQILAARRGIAVGRPCSWARNIRPLACKLEVKNSVVPLRPPVWAGGSSWGFGGDAARKAAGAFGARSGGDALCGAQGGERPGPARGAVSGRAAPGRCGASL